MSDTNPFDDNNDGDLVVKVEKSKPKLKPPPMYKVIMLNDDYTPMEFVTHVLQTFFNMDFEKAYRLMMTIHTVGQAVIGIFPRDIAETKSEQVNRYAQSCSYPLLSMTQMTD